MANASSAERWYLIHTQASREYLAAEHLKRQGYRPFVPSTWRSIRHARSIRTVRAAFFPGYLFVPLNLDADRWRPIDGTIGVLRIVKANGRPLPAPVGLVEGLVALTGKDQALDLAGALKPGSEVRFLRGPFADQIAVVEGMKGPDRVRVLLQMMQQSVPVEAAHADLAVA